MVAGGRTFPPPCRALRSRAGRRPARLAGSAVRPAASALAVVALQSDGSRSLISGRDGPRKRGEMPPEPSRAASMIPIPASLPSSDHIPGMADAEAQKKGKAA